MTRFVFDQFAKDYLTELLSPLGDVKTSDEVRAEVRQIDVRFTPGATPDAETLWLRMLGKGDHSALAVSGNEIDRFETLIFANSRRSIGEAQSKAGG